MLTRPSLLLSVALATAVNAHAEPSPCTSAPAQQAIATLFATLDQAWNARQAPQLAAQYDEQASLRIGPDNVELSGREQVERFFSDSFQGLDPRLTHRLSVRSTQQVGPYCAVDARALIERSGADGKSAPVALYSGFYLLRPQPDGMAIVALRAVSLGRPNSASAG